MEELRGIRSRTRNNSLFEKKANFLSPLFAHQPAFACAQLTACWSLVCSIAALRQNVFGPQNGLPISSAAQAEYKESVLWKQRRAISNITCESGSEPIHEWGYQSLSDFSLTDDPSLRVLL